MEELTKSPYQTTTYQPATRPSHQTGRPTGVTILTVLIALGILVNTADGIANLSLAPILGVYSLSIVLFQIFVVYGLWNMKTWSGYAAIILYCINILGAVFMAFFMLDTIVQMTIDNTFVPYGFRIDKAATRAAVQGMLMMSLVMAVIIGGIVIAYVNSKKDLFVN